MEEKLEVLEVTNPQIRSIPQHNRFLFPLPTPGYFQSSSQSLSETNIGEDVLLNQNSQCQQVIIFNSEFDSGNCGNVVKVSNFEYDIYTSPDRNQGTEQEGYSKSWFYFSVKGFLKGQIVKFKVQNVHMLWSLWNNKACSNYKPVYKVGQDGSYEKIDRGVQINMSEKNCLVLSFQFEFRNSDEEVFFSFSYPYEYSRCINMLKQITSEHANDSDIYCHRETIAKSTQGRSIDLLTISSRDGILSSTESYLDYPLFPFRLNEERAKRFRSNKPYVLITSRVHPGETPSSYALEGMIQFLLNKSDARAALLRHFFVFQIVPMLNPDGVFHGHYRMDIANNNLNRFYKLADPIKQPSIFAIRKLVEQLEEEHRLFFYMDLHAHAGKKGHFVYGNACDDIISQIENQTFAKILTMNNKDFEYQYCDFSKKHMKARDKFEEMTKEGCGRVQIHQMTNIIHAYTLECGFHQATTLNQLPNLSNTEFELTKGVGLDEQSESGGEDNLKLPHSFTPWHYGDMGKAILVTILDIFEKNPYSRIANSQFKQIDCIRRSIGWECVRIERFRCDPLAYRKARQSQTLIEEAFFNDFVRKGVFDMQHPLFQNVPQTFLRRFSSQQLSNIQLTNQQQQDKLKKVLPIFKKRQIIANGKNVHAITESKGSMFQTSIGKMRIRSEKQTNLINQEQNPYNLVDISALMQQQLYQQQYTVAEIASSGRKSAITSICSPRSLNSSKRDSPKPSQKNHISLVFPNNSPSAMRFEKQDSKEVTTYQDLFGVTSINTTPIIVSNQLALLQKNPPLKQMIDNINQSKPESEGEELDLNVGKIQTKELNSNPIKLSGQSHLLSQSYTTYKGSERRKQKKLKQFSSLSEIDISDPNIFVNSKRNGQLAPLISNMSSFIEIGPHNTTCSIESKRIGNDNFKEENGVTLHIQSNQYQQQMNTEKLTSKQKQNSFLLMQNNFSLLNSQVSKFSHLKEQRNILGRKHIFPTNLIEKKNQRPRESAPTTIMTASPTSTSSIMSLTSQIQLKIPNLINTYQGDENKCTSSFQTTPSTSSQSFNTSKQASRGREKLGNTGLTNLDINSQTYSEEIIVTSRKHSQSFWKSEPKRSCTFYLSDTLIDLPDNVRGNTSPLQSEQNSQKQELICKNQSKNIIDHSLIGNKQQETLFPKEKEEELRYFNNTELQQKPDFKENRNFSNNNPIDSVQKNIERAFIKSKPLENHLLKTTNKKNSTTINKNYFCDNNFQNNYLLNFNKTNQFVTESSLNQKGERTTTQVFNSPEKKPHLLIAIDWQKEKVSEINRGSRKIKSTGSSQIMKDCRQENEREIQMKYNPIITNEHGTQFSKIRRKVDGSHSLQEYSDPRIRKKSEQNKEFENKQASQIVKIISPESLNDDEKQLLLKRKTNNIGRCFFKEEETASRSIKYISQQSLN